VDATTLLVAARSSMAAGQVAFTTRNGQTWGGWQTIGTPVGTGDSSPAVTVTANQVHFFVIGGDGSIYEQICDVSGGPSQVACASAGASDDWHLLGGPGSPQKQVGGRPSAASPAYGVVAIAAAGLDGRLWVRDTTTGSWGDWTQASNMSTPVPPTEADSPGLASWGEGRLDLFVRNSDGLLVQTAWTASAGIDPLAWAPLGGLPVSAIGASATSRADSRISAVTLIDDHGQTGIWWKFFSERYRAPCNFNLGTTCARCGCDEFTLSCAGR
jgi:hypothetical protein